MSKIEILIKINKLFLKSEDYFQSLLEEAYKVKLISEKDVEKIQTDCLLLLARQTEQYNGYKSSSIKIEDAQQLLSSILFTLGVYLKTYENPDLALEALIKEGVFDIYSKGLKQINKLKITSKLLHKSILRKLIATDNEFYISTIIEGINGFFKLYNSEYGAHETHITADYPVYQKIEPLKGIEFISKYLDFIYYENLFCSFFLTEDIHCLLGGYDKNYSLIPFNIYEVVLLSALGCTLADKDYSHLEIDGESLEKLYDILNSKSKKEIENILKLALEKLIKNYDFSESLKNYLNNSLNQLSILIYNSILNNALNRVFIIPKYYDNLSKIIVSYGNKMNDEEYRALIDEIRQCRHFSDKKSIINLDINSLSDLEDVLVDGDFNEEEIVEILEDMNLSEVAALSKRNSMTNINENYNLDNISTTLSNALDTYKAKLSYNKKDIFIKMEELIIIE